MLAAYVYQEERKADIIAYGVGLAWGGKKARRKGRKDTKSDMDHLRSLMRGESDGSPISLTPDIVETIFAGDLVESDKPYIEPPKSAPGANIAADREYLNKINRVFEEYPTKRGRAK